MTTIPSFTLTNGRSIPALGHGVFQMTGDEVRTHLREAIELGYRHIDTANAYVNEVAAITAVEQAPYYVAPDEAPHWVRGPLDYSEQH